MTQGAKSDEDEDGKRKGKIPRLSQKTISITYPYTTEAAQILGDADGIICIWCSGIGPRMLI